MSPVSEIIAAGGVPLIQSGAPEKARRLPSRTGSRISDLAAWTVLCACVLAFATAITAFSFQFEPREGAGTLAVPAFVLALAASGLMFALCVPALVARVDLKTEHAQRAILLLMIGAGLAARLLLFASEPVLENDYRRYLWDGGVAAHGFNPYAHSPYEVSKLPEGTALSGLARQASDTLPRIGHRSLTTIYPPVAQGAFAIAHVISPWSLNSWRAILVAADAATLMLLFALLGELGRSRLWAALYWLNPLVLKEGFNSAHMEPILIPFVLLAILLVWRGRNVAGSVALGIAAGIKLWPVILAPLLFRVMSTKPCAWIAQAVVLVVLTVLWIAPMMLSASAETAGLAAYAEGWNTNSALNPALESLVARMFAIFGIASFDAGIAARGVAAAVLLALTIVIARRSWATLNDLLFGTAVTIGMLVLLSPAQYPWYLMWVLPFLAFRPSLTILTASITMPLYYTLFYFAAHDASDTFTGAIVWLIWVPVWIAAAYEARQLMRAGRGSHAPA